MAPRHMLLRVTSVFSAAISRLIPGSLPGPIRCAALVVTCLAAFLGTPTAALASSARAPQETSYDISWPQCRPGYPAAPSGHKIIGVTGGRAFTRNPCLADQYRRAVSEGAAPWFYLNVNYPTGPTVGRGDTGPRGRCAASDAGCRAYNYGFNTAQDADRYARSIGATASTWWLDVETANHWSRDTNLNAQVIKGAVDYFKPRGTVVGIYSIASMWQKIAGNYAPGLPNWVVRTHASLPVERYCSPSFAFGGGTVWLVQHYVGAHDADFRCPSAVNHPVATAKPVAHAAPATLTGSISGTLAGSPGGTSRFYAFAYPGNDRRQTITIDFAPSGPDVANALVVTVIFGGKPIAVVHGTDTPKPGHLTLDVTSKASGPVVVQLANYNPSTAAPIHYTIGRKQS